MSAPARAAYRRAIRLALRQPSSGMRRAAASQLRALAADPAIDAVRLQQQLLSRVAGLRAILPRRLWPESERARAFSLALYDDDTVDVSANARRRRSSRGTSKVPGVHADDLARHRKLIERMNFRGPVWGR